MPVRYLETMNSRISNLPRQRGFATDDQHAGAQRHLDLVELYPRQRDQDRQRIPALEDVAWRLPSSSRMTAMEELPIEPLGAFHRIASLFPHQRLKLLRHVRLPATG